MKKIYRLREWLTLDEASGHLSVVLGEPVSVAEVLRLALDRHLTLSVNLVNHAEAKPGARSVAEGPAGPLSLFDKRQRLLLQAATDWHQLVVEDAE